MGDNIPCVSRTNSEHTWKYNLSKPQQNKKIIPHLFKKIFYWILLYQLIKLKINVTRPVPHILDNQFR